MKEIYIVKEEEEQIARLIERKLLMLPIEAGILFVGVKVIPYKEKPIYELWIGCSREHDLRVVEPLVYTFLKDEIKEYSLVLKIEARRGLDRSRIKIN